MKNDVKVVRIEAQSGTSVQKSHGPYKGYRFGVVYVLEDERTVATTEWHRLQRDAKSHLARLQESAEVPAHPTKVMFDGEGKFLGISTSYDTLDFLAALDSLAK